MIYYQSPKAFRKNWLYVGEPFTLEEYYGARTIDENHAATQVIKEKWTKLVAFATSTSKALRKRRNNRQKEQIRNNAQKSGIVFEV